MLALRYVIVITGAAMGIATCTLTITLLDTMRRHQKSKHVTRVEAQLLYDPASELPTINMGWPFYRVKPPED